MRYTSDWKDYELLDCSSGERLERWGNVTLIRPDPQVIWKTPKKHPAWRRADAVFQGVFTRNILADIVCSD